MAYPLEFPCLWPQVDPDDARALSDVLNGNSEAYGFVVEKYWDRIYQRVYCLLRNHEDAEEITQDAFTRAMTSLDRFRGEASFSTWLFHIASNLARNRYWYWRRRKRESSMSLHLEISEGVQLKDCLAGSDENPREAMDLTEFHERIAEATARLPKLHRKVLELRLKQCMSYEAISERLGIPVGTVKSRIARARQTLSEHFQESS